MDAPLPPNAVSHGAVKRVFVGLCGGVLVCATVGFGVEGVFSVSHVVACVAGPDPVVREGLLAIWPEGVPRSGMDPRGFRGDALGFPGAFGLWRAWVMHRCGYFVPIYGGFRPLTRYNIPANRRLNRYNIPANRP
jgi:hypothetical protein